MSVQGEPYTVAVGVVVLDRRRRVLLVRRARAPSQGAWTLPGGHVELGETTEAAAVRELREETSLRVRLIASLGQARIEREGETFLIHEFLAVPIGDSDPRAGDDAAEARWVDRDELEQLGVHPDAIAFIDRGMADEGVRGPA